MSLTDTVMFFMVRSPGLALRGTLWIDCGCPHFDCARERDYFLQKGVFSSSLPASRPKLPASNFWLRGCGLCARFGEMSGLMRSKGRRFSPVACGVSSVRGFCLKNDEIYADVFREM